MPVVDFAQQRHAPGPYIGLTWSPGQIGTGPWVGVAFGAGAFVAVRNAASLQNIARSTNGYNWTIITTGAALNLSCVCYGEGVFIALAFNGAGNQIFRSIDYGLTWSNIAEPSTRQWTDVCYAGNGTFVAVAQDGVGNQIMRSTDRGATWASIAEPSTELWQAITYGASVWYAVGTNTAAATAAMYSNDDGATWNGVFGHTNHDIQAVAYCYDKFVVVRDSGAGSGSMTLGTSKNGIISTYHSETCWTVTRLKGICMGYDRAVIVGNTISLVS